MKNFRKKMKNQLDEMQEQKMLTIERNGCWLAFWGLLISLLVQLFLYGQGDFKVIAGEWIVFMLLALYIGIACLKNNVWDRRFSPTPAVNLAVSLVAGVVCGIIFFVISYHNYHSFSGAIATGLIIFVEVSVGCFIALSAALLLYRRRTERLENDDSEEKGV